MDLTDADVDRIKKAMKAAGIKMASIGSPIGKLKPGDPFEPQLGLLKRAFDLADAFDAPFVRVFSFFVDGEGRKKHRDDILKKIGLMAKVGKGRRALALHENEADVYGDNIEHVKEVLEAAGGAWDCVFDPGNFVGAGVKPFTEAYPALKDRVRQIHIKDHSVKENIPCVAGGGQGQIPELLAELSRSGKDFILSLEPHLASAGVFSGFSGIDKFMEASRALRGITQKLTA